MTPAGRLAQWLLCVLVASGATGYACILNPQQLPPQGQQPESGAGAGGSSSGSFGNMGSPDASQTNGADGGVASSSSSGSVSGSGSGSSSGSSVPSADAGADAAVSDATAGSVDGASEAGNPPGDASIDGLDDASAALDGAEGAPVDPDR